MNQSWQPEQHGSPLLPCLFAALMFAGAAGAAPAAPDAATAQAGHSVAAPKSYRVINLGPGGITGFSSFNAKDQIAISRPDAGGGSRAYLHDGKTLLDIGSLGGTQTVVRGLNDAGEVVGYSTLAGDAVYHAFKWSKRGGMRDLGTLNGVGNSDSGWHQPINSRGDVVGFSSRSLGQDHAFLWRPGSGMLDLGGLPGNSSGFSIAHAINNAGIVGGHGTSANGDTHAFVWTRNAGMTDIGTLGGSISGVVGISDDGLVLGNSSNASEQLRVYAWTRSGGMIDLGTAGGDEATSAERPTSRNGNLVGNIRFADDTFHAFLWTRTRGMLDLGTLGGPSSSSFAVNNKAQVVGFAYTSPSQSTAFIWTAKDGMIDLNTRLRHAPGVQVDVAYLISDNGVILAITNAGLALLKPDCGCAGPHTVGAIQSLGTIKVGAPFDASVAFAGADKAAQHNVFWSWGDGSGEQQGNARERDGAGSASASHRFNAPGMYTVAVKVSDRSGQGTTVSRTIVAYEPGNGGGAAGSGWFHSPAGANRQQANQADRATFAFLAPGIRGAKPTAANAMLQFQTGTLNFRSDSIKPLQAHDARARFEGSGKLNGVGGYRFRLTTTAGDAAGVKAGQASAPGQQSRFGLRIWRLDPASKAEVVVYDNLGAGDGSVLSAAQGNIVLQ
jgi:probable HAF family extracellular repeat protein